MRTGIFEDDGYVACIEVGESAQSIETFADAAQRFAATWDVSELGRLRYVYASRAAEDPVNRTFLFSVWSDGRLDLSRMLPRGLSDAEGTDPPGVPRLPGAQRLLSIYEANEPSGMFTYRTKASSDDVVEFFRTELGRSGWHPVPVNDGEPIELEGVRLVSAAKGSQHVTVLCPSRSSGSEMVTVLWTGTQG